MEILPKNNMEKTLIPMRINDEEGAHNFSDGVEENARDQTFEDSSEQFQMCPEASKLAWSNITEEELKYLSRKFNYDLKQKDASKRSDKKGEWLSRL